MQRLYPGTDTKSTSRPHFREALSIVRFVRLLEYSSRRGPTLCMNILLQDMRQALRALAAAPAFTLAAVLSLAIGIGANTAIFSIVDGLLLRPLPYKDAERLVILWNRSPGLDITEDWFSTAQYFDIKNGHRGFEQVAIAIGGNYNLTGWGEPERVGAIRVSSSLLPMLGQRAALGRMFVADEDLPDRTATAVLSYGTWTRRFGSDPGVLGKKIMLNGVPYEIVGVMPRSFSLPREVMPTLDGAEQAEILLPLPLPANAAQDRNHEDYNIVGKLKSGVSVQQAQAEMDTITARLRHDFPEVYPPNGGLTFGIVPLLEQVVGNVRSTLYLLLGAVGFRPADRMRQRGQPATVTRLRSPKGNRGPHGTGRNPTAYRSPIADRKRTSCLRRWRVGHCPGVSRLALRTAAWSAECTESERRRHWSCRSGLHVCDFHIVSGAVWAGTGAAGFAARRANRSPRHQSHFGGCQCDLGTR